MINSGHEVYIFTFDLADPLRDYTLNNIKKVNILNENSLKTIGDVDLIWAHHNTTIDYIINETSIKAKKIIYSSLSPYEKLEKPPLYINDLTLCLSNSIETKEILIKNGVYSNKIVILNNFITKEFYEFYKEIDLSLEYPKKICVVSNHVPETILSSIKLLNIKGINVDIYGMYHRFEMITPNILEKYDAIITIGKTVQYSLAMGIPVYCYDRFGGPGWITISNFNKSQDYNFSGRCSNRKINESEIVSEIITDYKQALEDTNLHLKYAIRNNNLLSKNIEKIFKILNQLEDLDIDQIRLNNTKK